eukprot:Lithocolla_globosa_v1_NODE_1946_length_2247_cov_3.497263.p2 type:complete len:109 gc:universal NODE_1946_length_2247_cov_3.497263:1268-1594(+)
MNNLLIENFKTVTVNSFLNIVNETNIDLYVEFIPDEIVLKSVSVFDDTTGPNTAMFFIKSNLIRENSNVLAHSRLGIAHFTKHITYLINVTNKFQEHIILKSLTLPQM